mmetsp:Transcript_5222/g.13174  ORF Transcript_5222/g.13174 Transcript_5222/m.13174 type:complete len:304 (-) Transcript_5222:608-1519(-)
MDSSSSAVLSVEFPALGVRDPSNAPFEGLPPFDEVLIIFFLLCAGTSSSTGAVITVAAAVLLPSSPDVEAGGAAAPATAAAAPLLRWSFLSPAACTTSLDPSAPSSSRSRCCSLCRVCRQTCCQRFFSSFFRTGLTRKSAAPSLKHCMTVSLLSWLDMTITGTCLHVLLCAGCFLLFLLSSSWLWSPPTAVDGWFLSSCRRSTPDTSGMSTSESTRSNLDVLSIASASLPFSTLTTSYSHASRSLVTIMRVVGSSSARRTRIFFELSRSCFDWDFAVDWVVLADRIRRSSMSGSLKGSSSRSS